MKHAGHVVMWSCEGQRVRRERTQYTLQVMHTAVLYRIHHHCLYSPPVHEVLKLSLCVTPAASTTLVSTRPPPLLTSPQCTPAATWTLFTSAPSVTDFAAQLMIPPAYAFRSSIAPRDGVLPRAFFLNLIQNCRSFWYKTSNYDAPPLYPLE